MANDIVENMVLDFLKAHKGETFSVRELVRLIKDKNKASPGYPTFLKTVDILIARGEIQVKEYGTSNRTAIKSVWV